jgi:hypothetical protein
VTFASRLSFLTVQVEKFKLRQLEVVPGWFSPLVLVLPFTFGHRLQYFYPSLNALLPSPLRSPPLLLTLSLSLSSVFIPLRVGYSSKTICADFLTFLRCFSLAYVALLSQVSPSPWLNQDHEYHSSLRTPSLHYWALITPHPF